MSSLVDQNMAIEYVERVILDYQKKYGTKPSRLELAPELYDLVELALRERCQVLNNERIMPSCHGVPLDRGIAEPEKLTKVQNKVSTVSGVAVVLANGRWGFVIDCQSEGEGVINRLSCETSYDSKEEAQEACNRLCHLIAKKFADYVEGTASMVRRNDMDVH